MKKMTRLLIVVFTVILLAVNISAGTAVLKDQDADTHGDWVGKYGSEGYILFKNSEEEDNNHLPSYVTLEHEALFGDPVSRAVWYDESAGGTPSDNSVNSLYADDTQTSRIAACIYNAQGMNITIDVGSTPKLVSLYCIDYDLNGRGMTLTVFDENGTELGTQDVVEFDGGKYITAEVTGKVKFELVLFEATNTVVSGIFFDPVAGAATTEPVVSPAATTEPEQTEAEVSTDPVTTEVKAEPIAPETSDAATVIVALVISFGVVYISLKNKKQVI